MEEEKTMALPSILIDIDPSTEVHMVGQLKSFIERHADRFHVVVLSATAALTEKIRALKNVEMLDEARESALVPLHDKNPNMYYIDTSIDHIQAVKNIITDIETFLLTEKTQKEKPNTSVDHVIHNMDITIE